MKKIALILLAIIFVAASCNNSSSVSSSSISNYDDENNSISRDDAIYNYWDEVRDYLSGSETIEACSSSGCYDLDVDISDGYVQTIYFPNGGYLEFYAEIDDNGYASDYDRNGNDWEFSLDMDSSIVDDAVSDWASSNDYEINF